MHESQGQTSATPRRRQPPRRGESGSALVEMVIVLLLIFIPLIWGLITFGYAFSIRENMFHASQEGLRTAVLSGISPSTPTQTIECAAVVDARSRMTTILGSHSNASVTDPTCASTVTSDGGLDIVPSVAACSDGNGGTISGSSCLTVTLTYQYGKYPVIAPAPGIFALVPKTMTVSATQRLPQ